MGTQAPLLPFILAVLAAGIIGGRGPAILAALLVPVIATLEFANWQYGPDMLAWTGHVAFFLVVTLSVVAVLHRLQVATRAQEQAVLEALNARREAAENEAQMRLIADGVPVLISYVDAERRYRFANRSFTEWFAKKPGELLGLYVREVLSETAYAADEPRIQKALGGERVDFAADIRLASGLRHVSAHYVPDIAADGEVRGFFALLEDVTERRRAEDVLRTAERRKDEFLAMLAHELRNPLASLRNVSYMLLHAELTPPVVRQNSEVLQRQVTTLTRLVDDLLDVSRLTHGTINLRKERVMVSSILIAAVESAQPLFRMRQQTLRTDLGGANVRVEADPLRLCQVFGNILANAAKYSPEHAVITIDLEELGDEVIIRINDPGVGIAPEDLPRIFEVFVQGDHSRDLYDGGIGVGLTIARTIVELHGGKLEARSEGLGKGSEFSVRLKRLPSTESARCLA